MDNIAIDIKNLTKLYKLYNKPIDRLKESLKIGKKKYFKEHYALRNISFQVQKGETVGIIGTNGAGKSTLLKIITGVLYQTSGEIRVNGKISALLELGAGFNPEYTGIENIYLNGTMVGFEKNYIQKKLDSIIEFADIGSFINQPVKMYSSGMFARLAFAVAINIEPDILIVDEALSVGDIAFQSKCFRKFEELRNNGVTIVFVSHDINSVKQMCDRVLWIEKGEQRQFGDKELVCSLYIDEQRKKSNEYVDIKERKSIELTKIKMDKNKRKHYPKFNYVTDSFKSEYISIESCFISDEKMDIVNELSVGNSYTIHVVIKMMSTLENLIVGVSIENNKGLPLFGVNNYMQQGTVLKGIKGEVIEVCFKIKLPKLMKGNYTVNPAVAMGTQEENKILTWLHNTDNLYVNNEGYNDSLIEIDSEVSAYKYSQDSISIVDRGENVEKSR